MTIKTIQFKNVQEINRLIMEEIKKTKIEQLQINSVDNNLKKIYFLNWSGSISLDNSDTHNFHEDIQKSNYKEW